MKSSHRENGFKSSTIATEDNIRYTMQIVWFHVKRGNAYEWIQSCAMWPACVVQEHVPTAANNQWLTKRHADDLMFQVTEPCTLISSKYSAFRTNFLPRKSVTVARKSLHSFSLCLKSVVSVADDNGGITITEIILDFFYHYAQ